MMKLVFRILLCWGISKYTLRKAASAAERLAGVTNAEDVRAWAQFEETPEGVLLRRLRQALEAGIITPAEVAEWACCPKSRFLITGDQLRELLVLMLWGISEDAPEEARVLITNALGFSLLKDKETLARLAEAKIRERMEYYLQQEEIGSTSAESFRTIYVGAGDPDLVDAAPERRPRITLFAPWARPYGQALPPKDLKFLACLLANANGQPQARGAFLKRLEEVVPSWLARLEKSGAYFKGRLARVYVSDDVPQKWADLTAVVPLPFTVPDSWRAVRPKSGAEQEKLLALVEFAMECLRLEHPRPEFQVQFARPGVAGKFNRYWGWRAGSKFVWCQMGAGTSAPKHFLPKRAPEGFSKKPMFQLLNGLAKWSWEPRGARFLGMGESSKGRQFGLITMVLEGGKPEKVEPYLPRIMRDYLVESVRVEGKQLLVTFRLYQWDGAWQADEPLAVHVGWNSHEAVRHQDPEGQWSRSAGRLVHRSEVVEHIVVNEGCQWVALSTKDEE